MAYTSPKFNGEPSAAALANGLATLGRYGDSYMVHASDGETLIPGEIFDANPKLKADLFNQMKVMGIRDPNRYVVGNSLNSINPITGQPEFFFKKIFKTIKKVFKKALPYVAPIVGNMIAPGIGGIIASGLVSKLQGGSWGDVAKDMAISYGVGALGQGLTSSKGFMTGLGEGLTAPWHAGKALFSGGAENPLAQGIFGSGGQLFGQSTDLGLGFSGGDVMRSEGVGGLYPSYQRNPQMATGQTYSQQVATAQQGLGFGAPQAGRYGDPVTVGGPGIKAVQYGGSPVAVEGDLSPSAAKWEAVRQTTPVGEYQLGPVPPEASSTATTTAAGTEKAAPRLWSEDFAPGGETAARLAEHAAIPALIAGLTYLLTEDDKLDPDDEKQLVGPQRYAYDKYLEGRQADPNFKNTPEGQALLAQAGIVPSTDPQALARATGTSLDQANAYLGSMYGQPTAVAAKGGIVTLQGGGEIMGPGSGISDSIPARLSDGEFVMTADAVRGAGNGSRDMGAARMYDLMSRFERAA